MDGSVSKDQLSLAAGDSGVLTAPFRLQDWYDMEREYLTAPKAEVSAFLLPVCAKGRRPLSGCLRRFVFLFFQLAPASP